MSEDALDAMIPGSGPPAGGPTKWSRLGFPLCFAAFCLLGFAVRYYGVSAKPFWMDEITTIHRASLPLRRIVSDSIFFHQLPAFFIVTSWVLPFGHDEVWIRLPAMFFGALSCALGFGVARALGGMRAGLTAGLLLALSPAQVQYGQEARSYTMVICAILIGLWGLAVLAKDPEGASVWPMWKRQTAMRGAWAAYILGTAAALNVLGVALFWYVASNLAAIVLGIVSKARTGRRGFWVNWLLAQGVIIVLCAPWYIAIKLLGQRGALGGLDWVPPLTLERFWWTFDSTYFMRATSLITVKIFPAGVPGFGFVVFALALAGAFALRRHRAALALLVLATFAPPLCLLAISIATPVWMPRYALWSAVPLFICAGLGMAILPKPAQLPAILLLSLLALANLWPYYSDETKPRWDLAAAELNAALAPGDLILVDDPQAISMMNIYLERLHERMLTPADWTESLAKAQAWRNGGRQVWAVQGLVGQVDKENRTQFLQRIAPLGSPVMTENAGENIIVMEYAAGGPG